MIDYIDRKSLPVIFHVFNQIKLAIIHNSIALKQKKPPWTKAEYEEKEYIVGKMELYTRKMPELLEGLLRWEYFENSSPEEGSLWSVSLHARERKEGNRKWSYIVEK